MSGESGPRIASPSGRQGPMECPHDLRRVRRLKVASKRDNGAAPPRPDDRVLIAGILRALETGDSSTAQEHYRVLVEAYQERGYLLAYQILRNEPDAEDVVQESFVKAYLSLADFKGQSSFYTWFYRIVFNMALDLKRKVTRRRSVPASTVGAEGRDENAERFLDRVTADQSVGAGNVETPDSALERREQRALLQRELANLSDEHRAVITLRDIDGLSYEEIAQALSLPINTVRTKLYRARQRLMQIAAERGWDSLTE